MFARLQKFVFGNYVRLRCRASTHVWGAAMALVSKDINKLRRETRVLTNRHNGGNRAVRYALLLAAEELAKHPDERRDAMKAAWSILSRPYYRDNDRHLRRAAAVAFACAKDLVCSRKFGGEEDICVTGRTLDFITRRWRRANDPSVSQAVKLAHALANPVAKKCPRGAPYFNGIVWNYPAATP